MTLALYLASGWSLFLGAAFCAAAPGIDKLRRRPPGVAILVLIAGMLLVALSATPTPWPISLVGLVAAIGWPARRRRTGPRSKRVAAGCAIVLAIAAILAAAVEIPRAMMPNLAAGEARRLVVLGDSLSAGLGDGVETWPARLAAEHSIDVQNLARAGATAHGAIGQAESIPGDADVVVVLIGGNDYMQGRPAADFERDLETVISLAGAGGRRVVMFELPVLPLGNSYLAAQRRVGDRQGAAMIPRRRLAMALAGGGATSDGMHLSAAGQTAVARIAWEAIGPAFAARARGVTPDESAGDGEAPRDGRGDNTAGSQTDGHPDTSSLKGDRPLESQPASAPGDEIATGLIAPLPEESSRAADSQSVAPIVEAARPLRLVTWNVQKCEGGVEAIVDRLRAIDADVVCLQELVGPGEGSAVEDQTRRIADELGLFVHFDCGQLDGSRVQCIAILSKTPLRDEEVLRTAEDRAYGIAARVKRREGAVRVVCVHLAGTWRLDAGHIAETTARREAECAALATWVERRFGDERLGVRAAESDSPPEEPLVIAGDFNPASGECVERLGRMLTRVEGIGATFPSSLPVLELDRVFCSSMLRIRSARCDESVLSDHRPVVVELSISAATD